ncbi:MAG: helix-turn-helix transcriptional regulator [Coriobacteriales bacterium]|nr:helix-turn-helix transcriptional regulator [Coriobacteriales bacterium]
MLSALRPHVSSWGYALFLTINATSIWGGIFPFLPLEFQTDAVTLTFFLAQAFAFGGAFVASAFGSYFFPRGARIMLVSLSALLVFAGSVCLIAAMYLSEFTMILTAGGGIFLGVGCAGMFMLWQRYFASLGAKPGNLRLIIGTAIAPIIYFALHVVPIALTAFLIPLIFVPLCALCVSLSVREMKIDQPMFEDVPRMHPKVYRQTVKDHWRSALCVGSLAFASGVIRSIALVHQEVFEIVNISSMIGSLVSAVVLLIVWFRFSVRFNLTSVFRVVYPIVITGFLLLPFLGAYYLNLFAALTYMIFSLVLMLMMIQSAQIARDRGINPVFIYALFGSVAYIMQSLGFLLGWFSDELSVFSADWLFVIAMLSSYVLGITLLVASGTLFRSLTGKAAAGSDPIEFISLKRAVAGPGQATELAGVAEEGGTTLPTGPAKRHTIKRHRPSPSEDYGVIRDRVTKQSLVLRDRFGLSSREAEVMELIARGNSVATITEKLVISENTVRTHSRHIYTKLDIHKRQELLDLLESMDPGEGQQEYRPQG